MKTYKEIADEVLRRRDEYETKRRGRINAVKRAGTVAACLVAAAGVSFSVYFIAKSSLDGNAENEDYSEADGVKSNALSHGASEGYEGVDDGVADGEATDTDDSAVSDEELYETEGNDDHSAENSANPKESSESGVSNLYESESDEVTDGDENDGIVDSIVDEIDGNVDSNVDGNVSFSYDNSFVYCGGYDELQEKLYLLSSLYGMAEDAALIPLIDGEPAGLVDSEDAIAISISGLFGDGASITYRCVDAKTGIGYRILTSEDADAVSDAGFEYTDAVEAEIALADRTVTALIYYTDDEDIAGSGNISVVAAFEYDGYLAAIVFDSENPLTDEFFASLSFKLLSE
ncbi:MAG: hypothetical protein LUD43_00530 [Firmicutes bacterium]|nr:hypothetical protein [Bacillota bacterium]